MNKGKWKLGRPPMVSATDLFAQGLSGLSLQKEDPWGATNGEVRMQTYQSFLFTLQATVA